ncbi:MAG: hypothetical protein HY543_06685, partial [Deltaproteobacteria bacterium]|nr:hypothetical protein [Deltaproteobacteria bacterium]
MLTVGAKQYLMAPGDIITSSEFAAATHPRNFPVKFNLDLLGYITRLKEQRVLGNDTTALAIAPDDKQIKGGEMRLLLPSASPEEYVFLLHSLLAAGVGNAAQVLRPGRPPTTVDDGAPGSIPWPADPLQWLDDKSVGMWRPIYVNPEAIGKGPWTKFLGQMNNLKAGATKLIDPKSLLRVDAVAGAISRLQPTSGLTEVFSVAQYIEQRADKSDIYDILRQFTLLVPEAPKDHASQNIVLYSFSIPRVSEILKVTMDRFTPAVNGLSRETIAVLRKELHDNGIHNGMYRLGTDGTAVIFRIDKEVIGVVDAALAKLADKLADGSEEEKSILVAKEGALAQARSLMTQKESEVFNAKLQVVMGAMFIGGVAELMRRMWSRIAHKLWHGYTSIANVDLARHGGRPKWVDIATGGFRDVRYDRIIRTAKRVWEEKYKVPITEDSIKGIHHKSQWRACVVEAERQDNIKEALKRAGLDVVLFPTGERPDPNQAGWVTERTVGDREAQRRQLEAEPLTPEAEGIYNQAVAAYQRAQTDVAKAAAPAPATEATVDTPSGSGPSIRVNLLPAAKKLRTAKPAKPAKPPKPAKPAPVDPTTLSGAGWTKAVEDARPVAKPKYAVGETPLSKYTDDLVALDRAEQKLPPHQRTLQSQDLTVREEVLVQVSQRLAAKQNVALETLYGGVGKDMVWEAAARLLRITEDHLAAKKAAEAAGHRYKPAEEWTDLTSKLKYAGLEMAGAKVRIFMVKEAVLSSGGSGSEGITAGQIAGILAEIKDGVMERPDPGTVRDGTPREHAKIGRGGLKELIADGGNPMLVLSELKNIFGIGAHRGNESGDLPTILRALDRGEMPMSGSWTYKDKAGAMTSSTPGVGRFNGIYVADLEIAQAVQAFRPTRNEAAASQDPHRPKVFVLDEALHTLVQHVSDHRPIETWDIYNDGQAIKAWEIIPEEVRHAIPKNNNGAPMLPTVGLGRPVREAFKNLLAW